MRGGQMRPRLLSVSNGHGEDLIAAAVLRQLPGRAVVAYPLVGLGEAYPPEVERLDPRRAFPSGGVSFPPGNPGPPARPRRGRLPVLVAAGGPAPGWSFSGGGGGAQSPSGIRSWTASPPRAPTSACPPARRW